MSVSEVDLRMIISSRLSTLEAMEPPLISNQIPMPVFFIVEADFMKYFNR